MSHQHCQQILNLSTDDCLDTTLLNPYHMRPTELKIRHQSTEAVLVGDTGCNLRGFTGMKRNLEYPYLCQQRGKMHIHLLYTLLSTKNCPQRCGGPVKERTCWMNKTISNYGLHGWLWVTWLTSDHQKKHKTLGIDP